MVSNNNLLNDIVTSLVSTMMNSSASNALKGSSGVIQSTLSNEATSPLNNLLTPERPAEPQASAPKGYLNILFFDEQFNYVNSSFMRVNTACDDSRSPLMLIDKEVPKNGWAYVYLSNESDEPVYFDNFQVTHERGKIIEENHYYSYGLKIEGISSRAQETVLNRYGYQGDFSEHDEETALDEFDLRHFDPQTGKWTTTDPYEQFASPYLGMGNSPVGNVDPDGGCIFCETAERALRLAEVVITMGKGNSSGSFLSNVLANSKEFINPIINSSINAISKTGSGISWFSKGLWNEGAVPTVDWVNHNLNPLYLVPNGINSQFTGQDFLSGTPMTHAEGISDAILPFIPFGKFGAIAEKTLFKRVENAAAKTVGLGAQYSVAFETKLASNLYPGKGYYSHFKAANTSLSNAMASDAAFSSSMSKLGISIPRSPAGSILGKSPANWVWHHDVGTGVMQLVPKAQHTTGGMFWNTMHPGGVGGMSIWGR